MNERIQQLAEQAGIKRVDLHYTEEQPPYTIVSYRGSPDNPDPLAEFAELIVRECIDIISPYTVRMSRPGEECLHPIQEIKQHFGVKE